jgi:outer membrane protein TolC
LAHRLAALVPVRGREAAGSFPRSAPSKAPSWFGVALAFGTAALAGCRSPEAHAAAADAQVYRIVAERRAALEATGEFTLDGPQGPLRQELLELPRAERAIEEPLDLATCLVIAAENSRAFRAAREQLYLAALDLTLERFRLSIQTSGTLGAALLGDDEGANTAVVGGNVGLQLLLGTVALVVGSIGLDLARSLVTSDGWGATSRVGLGITQPLLAGFGRAIVEEPLTQAERNVVYAVRDHERFRRTFAVDVATRVYRLLQLRDTVANEEANFQSLVLVRERNEAMAAAGRLSEIQVDQARQDELRARSRVIARQQQLESLHDDFKVLLGLPVETRIEIDANELVRLVERGLAVVELAEEDAVDLALDLRLDYHNVLDRIDDAERRVVVAADALRALVAVSADVEARSDVGAPLEFSDDGVSWRLGLDVSLPFERLPQRNAYRASLISLDVATRNAEASRDSLVSGVRAALRELVSRRQDYDIQLNAVALAERRVESTRLNFEAARAQTRDLLEAQNALLEARNALTSAMVDHRIAVLTLLRDLEVLRVDEAGLLLESEPLESLARRRTEP